MLADLIKKENKECARNGKGDMGTQFFVTVKNQLTGEIR